MSQLLSGYRIVYFLAEERKISVNTLNDTAMPPLYKACRPGEATH